MKSVQLHPAYAWRCPECDHFQTETFAPVELTPDEKDGILRDFDQIVTRQELDGAIALPGTVQCEKCHKEFDAA